MQLMQQGLVYHYIRLANHQHTYRLGCKNVDDRRPPTSSCQEQQSQADEEPHS